MIDPAHVLDPDAHGMPWPVGRVYPAKSPASVRPSTVAEADDDAEDEDSTKVRRARPLPCPAGGICDRDCSIWCRRTGRTE